MTGYVQPQFMYTRNLSDEAHFAGCLHDSYNNASRSSVSITKHCVCLTFLVSQLVIR